MEAELVKSEFIVETIDLLRAAVCANTSACRVERIEEASLLSTTGLAKAVVVLAARKAGRKVESFIMAVGRALNWERQVLCLLSGIQIAMRASAVGRQDVHICSSSIASL